MGDSDRAEDAVAELERSEGVARVRMTAGQVLMYQDHLAPGVFVLVSGSVKLEGPADRARATVLRAGPGPVPVLPDPAELERPQEATTTMLEESDLLFVPRSLATSEDRAGELVRALHDRWSGAAREA